MNGQGTCGVLKDDLCGLGVPSRKTLSNDLDRAFQMASNIEYEINEIEIALFGLKPCNPSNDKTPPSGISDRTETILDTLETSLKIIIGIRERL